MDPVFVGRRDEQVRFGALLDELLSARRRWRLGRPRVAPADGSRVVLVHGLGGSGKSKLLRRFEAMANGDVPESRVRAGQIKTVWLDWEDEQRDNPSGYAGIDGPSLVTVLDALQRAVVEAFDMGSKASKRAHEAFEDYRRGVARMPEYAARFAELLAQGRQADSSISQGDLAVLLRLMGSAGSLLGGSPTGLMDMTPDQVAASMSAVGRLSRATVRAVTGKKEGELSLSDYELVNEPERELTRRVAEAIRTSASVPLVVLLDTGEVIGVQAWRWLRRVMARTGCQVTWVVGARFETDAEAGVDSPIAAFGSDVGDEQLVLMTPRRFDDQMIADYLVRRTGSSFTPAEVDQVATFTRGLPLAVSFAAGLLEDGQSVGEVCQEVDDGQPSSVITRLARRYLVHAEQRQLPEDDPRRHDVDRILGLALAYGDLRGDRELLTALWDVDDPLPVFQDLARRHDFVLPLSRRLHDDVRDVLRTDLLDSYRRARVKAINQRALDLYTARVREMRARWPTLDQQLGNEDFGKALLAALWHSLWLDNQTGLDLFVHMLPVLVVASPGHADAVVAIISDFVGALGDHQRLHVDTLTEVRGPTVLGEWLARREGSRSAVTTRRRTVIGPDGMALLDGGSSPPDLTVAEPKDRQAAVHVMRARNHEANGDDRTAVAELGLAATSTQSSRMRHVVGAEARSIAAKLIWAGPDELAAPTSIGLAAALLAAETMPDDVAAHRYYGVALSVFERWDDALAAVDRALAIAADDSLLHYDRGVILGRAGRFVKALAAYDRAIELDPSNLPAHNNRGNLLGRAGRLEEALAAYDRAIQLRDDGVVHNNRGLALHHLGRLEEALAALDRAIELNSHDQGPRVNKGILLVAMGDLDAGLDEFLTAERCAPEGAGEGMAWAGAILWHRGKVEAAKVRFGTVEGHFTGCTPFRAAEMEAIALCGLGRVEEAERRLQEAVPLRVPGDATDPREIYDLLSDPPMAGIERLRRIVEGDEG